MLDIFSFSQEVGIPAQPLSRLRRFGHAACRTCFAGVLSVSVSATVGALVHPEIIKTEAVVARPALSDSELVRRQVEGSMYHEEPVNMLADEIAWRTYTASNGTVYRQTMAQPVWVHVDGKDYVAGRDNLAPTRQLKIWQLAADAQLCSGNAYPTDAESVYLGLDVNSWGFEATGIGVVRSGFDTSADVCWQTAELAGIDKVPVT